MRFKRQVEAVLRLLYEAYPEALPPAEIRKHTGLSEEDLQKVLQYAREKGIVEGTRLTEAGLDQFFTDETLRELLRILEFLFLVYPRDVQVSALQEAVGLRDRNLIRALSLLKEKGYVEFDGVIGEDGAFGRVRITANGIDAMPVLKRRGRRVRLW